MKKLYYDIFDTKLCQVLLVGNNDGLKILEMKFLDELEKDFKINENWEENNDFFTDIREQILEYFDGKRKKFNIKLNLDGTDFQKKVWEQLIKIPYGETASYKEIATKVGNSKASRAVGLANNKNPIPIIIPCHRVIGSDGKLTGFAHGIGNKQKLLDLEK
ncbi:MAG: methylated-DNA--[protein]-cysteine S-methyltransferase [Candidatus Gracilibacteria bacterium]|nr:methylated-DNA--[protein]-cysteine S-methyltransferase [Candidatus Gracilibacteria bacterium]